MSYIETMNLIDFGTEDVKQTALEQTVKESIPSKTKISQEPTATLVPHVRPVKFSCLNAVSQEERRESLDNNPFDSVQKLANRPDDPFEIVEKEACQKARSSQVRVDVKLGNLLSLSGDNLLDDADIQINKKITSCVTEKNYESPQCASDSIAYSNCTSSVYNTANSCNILDSESPPISMSQKWTTDSGNSSESVGESASSDAGNSTKTRKILEYRKRLLKLSLSNSTFNSPVSRRTAQSSDCFAETNNISMILTEAAQIGEHLIAAESPLKLVDDDLMSEEPNWIDSEKDFDDDLEMLKIPMLKQLPSPVVEDQKSVDTQLQTINDENIITKEAAPLTDLNAIRAKLKAKRELSNNNQDISLLIDSLKSLIADINVGDVKKKQQAACLLDTLSSALKSGTSKQSEEITTQQEETEVPTLAPQPKPIVRQGTFDIELQDKKQENKNSDQDYENACQDVPSPQSIETGINCEEMPDAMIRSSATYDGENVEEKQDFILPEIQPIIQPQLDVNDIVEQLGKLLEQHQLNNKHATETGIDGGASQSANINPTFIVVMNTTQTPLTTASVQQHCSYMASCLENSFNDDSPTINSHSNSMMRRRSQSLSIHDKVKVLQLPMMSTNVEPVTVECDRQSNVSPEVTPPLDAERPEFKTPSRAMARRNSFSSGTSLTPMHSNFGGIAAQRRASGMSEISSQMQMRRSTALATHHERQQNLSSTSAIIRPMQHLNLNSLKPDLTNKKKPKSNKAAESILKSTGPMKATIPVKKVAPMLKTSPPTPDIAVFKAKPISNLNSSVQLVGMSGKIPHTSTPMPHSRGATVPLEIAPGLPNACSTPSVRTSPMKRSMINASRRYSFLSATPSAKHSAPSSAAASGLRRRTLCELKQKSPIKPRLSSFGGAASTATYSSGKTTGVTRNSAKITTNVSRTVQNKSAPTPSTRTASRLSSRTSFASTTATKRNKENKLP